VVDVQLSALGAASDRTAPGLVGKPPPSREGKFDDIHERLFDDDAQYTCDVVSKVLALQKRRRKYDKSRRAYPALFMGVVLCWKDGRRLMSDVSILVSTDQHSHL
jgi:hypothetical protein